MSAHTLLTVLSLIGGLAYLALIIRATLLNALNPSAERSERAIKWAWCAIGFAAAVTVVKVIDTDWFALLWLFNTSAAVVTTVFIRRTARSRREAEWLRTKGLAREYGLPLPD